MTAKEQIEHALEVLAMSSTAQLQYLQALGTYPLIDELALEFGDAYGFFRGQVRTGAETGVSFAALRGLAKIDVTLALMSDQKESFSWYAECLDDPRWEAVRQQASATLDQIRGR